MSQASCGCGSSTVARFVELAPAAEPVTLSTKLSWRDILGGWRVRWDMGRMSYRVAPGLYRIGEPDETSPVLVTANYKLTVDAVRRELKGLAVWLLILDTGGVNVWCAAGKGTFGTAELVRRIGATNLAAIVKHRHLVLPQLGATGVAAHEVKRATGFLVHYGPIRARDIRDYLAAGMKATPSMRRVTFNWRERMVVAPVEIVGAMKPALIILAALAVLDLVSQRRLTSHLAVEFLPFLVAMLTGGLLVPLFLPLLPFRSFALKGAVAGAIVVAPLLLLSTGRLEATGVVLLVLSITSYMGMMFTGATTFTTLAGVKLEVRRALPVIIGVAALGTVLRAAAVFV